MTTEYKPMTCPVCGDFYFSELQEGDTPDTMQCLRCGWHYDLFQTENPDSTNGSNRMSCNQYKKWFNEKIKKNPEYDYLTDHLPDPMPHKCPICERHLFRDEWSYDICPYCGWEDDGSEDDDTGKVGCNGMTFSDYKKKYLSLVAKDPNYRWHK